MVVRNKLKWIFLLCFAGVFLTLRLTHGKAIENINANLYANTAPKFLKAMTLNNTVEISSTGGKTSVALNISDKMRANNITVIVGEECLSNCAEILLPAASEIIFKNNPLIGFHGNALSARYTVEKYALRNIQFCNWVYSDKFIKLYEATGHNVNFWKIQMKHLEPNVVFSYELNKCPQRNFNFKNRMWLPNSVQLKKDLGLKFTGSVCADYPLCYEKKISRRYAKGTPIAVGDTVYISKGKKIWNLFPQAPPSTVNKGQ